MSSCGSIHLGDLHILLVGPSSWVTSKSSWWSLQLVNLLVLLLWPQGPPAGLPAWSLQSSHTANLQVVLLSCSGHKADLQILLAGSLSPSDRPSPSFLLLRHRPLIKIFRFPFLVFGSSTCLLLYFCKFIQIKCIGFLLGSVRRELVIHFQECRRVPIV